MNTLGLLRHGPTSWNREKRIQGTCDIPLDLGSFYSAAWQQLLEAHGPWDCIVTSPLSRCRQTARLLFPDQQPLVHDGLREQDWGDWTGRTLPEIRLQDMPQVKLQEQRGWAFTPPAGESRTHLRDRVLNAIADICRSRDNSRILLVTHLGVIKVLINHILQTPFLPDDSAKVIKRGLHLISQDGPRLQILQKNKTPP